MKERASALALAEDGGCDDGRDWEKKEEDEEDRRTAPAGPHERAELPIVRVDSELGGVRCFGLPDGLLTQGRVAHGRDHVVAALHFLLAPFVGSGALCTWFLMHGL